MTEPELEEPVTVTCSYGCGWSNTFATKADAATGLLLHEALCDRDRC